MIQNTIARRVGRPQGLTANRMMKRYIIAGAIIAGIKIAAAARQLGVSATGRAGTRTGRERVISSRAYSGWPHRRLGRFPSKWNLGGRQPIDVRRIPIAFPKYVAI
jgi:hypothetical protein